LIDYRIKHSGACFFPVTGFSTLGAVAMTFGPLRVIPRVLIADAFAHPAQPESRPGKFGAEYSQPERYHEEARAWRDQHDDTEQNDGRSDREHGNATGGPVGQVRSFSDHRAPRGSAPYAD
jgi:hypothetical protein